MNYFFWYIFFVLYFMFEILKKWIKKDKIWIYVYFIWEGVNLFVEIEKFSCGMVYCVFLKLEILI